MRRAPTAGAFFPLPGPACPPVACGRTAVWHAPLIADSARVRWRPVRMPPAAAGGSGRTSRGALAGLLSAAGARGAQGGRERAARARAGGRPHAGGRSRAGAGGGRHGGPPRTRRGLGGDGAPCPGPAALPRPPHGACSSDLGLRCPLGRPRCAALCRALPGRAPSEPPGAEEGSGGSSVSTSGLYLSVNTAGLSDGPRVFWKGSANGPAVWPARALSMLRLMLTFRGRRCRAGGGRDARLGRAAGLAPARAAGAGGAAAVPGRAAVRRPAGRARRQLRGSHAPADAGGASGGSGIRMGLG